MKCMNLLFLFGMLCLAACSAVPPTVASTSPVASYAVTDVSVVDVEKGIVIPAQTVIVSGDRIAQVGAQGKLKIPNGTTTIPGSGLYLMPGLIDAHVHYLDAPVFGRLMLANGVLLVRDMGMPNEYILKLRDGLNRGETLGPEMVATGAILDANPPQIPSISISVSNPEEGRQAVRQQAAAGADMIKAYGSLDKTVFLAILDEAKKNNLKVVAHLPETIYIEDAAAAGLASSEHFNGFEKVIAKLLGEPVRLTFVGLAADAKYFQRLNEVNPEELRAVYQHIQASGMTVCPTVVTFKAFAQNSAFQTGDFPHSEYVSQTVRDTWKAMWGGQTLDEYIWRNWVQMVKGLDQAGVPLMLGTDLLLPGILPGYSVHEEMAIWQEAGIPAAHVLRSATIIPARFMGLGDRIGTIREGKTASMILVRGNPLEDVKNAQKIESIFLRGQYYNREDLNRLLDEARQLVKQPNP